MTERTEYVRENGTKNGAMSVMVQRVSIYGLLAAACVLISVPTVAQTKQTPADDPKIAAPASVQKAGGAVAKGGQVAPESATESKDSRSAAYYHYGLAHIYEDLATTQGRSDYATQAVEQYKQALAADPNSVFLQNGLAELYFKVGRIREAVTSAQEQVKKDPDDLAAHQLLGRIYFRSLGDVQNSAQTQMLQLAIAEYEKLIQLDANSVENRLLLGQLYELNHDSAKAEVQFRAAQGLDAGSEEAVLNMARLYSEQGDMQRVVTTLSALPESDRTARIEFALGASYDQLHKPKEAAAAYKRAVDIDGDNLDAQRGYANALLADNQMDAAMVQFQQIVAAEPQDAKSYISISEIQRRQGKYDVALTTLKKAKALVPDSLELSFNEALIYDALGRYDEAETVLKTTLASSAKADGSYADAEKSNRAIFLDRAGIVYKEQNKTQAAIEIYKQMIDLGGDFRARGFQGQVDVYRDAHQWNKATEVAAAAAKALPDEKQVQMMYAGQLADSGHVDEGLALAKSQLTGKPDDRDIYISMAQIDIRLKRWAEASGALDKADALSSKPDDKLYVYFLRGNLADKQKRREQAETELRKVLAIDPTSAMTLNYLSYMFAEREEKLPEALSMAKKAVELDPQNGAYLDSLGWTYFKLGQYALAEESLTKAAERMGTDPTIHDHLGQVYEKTGKLKLAVSQWERALSEYDKSLPADIDTEDLSHLHKRLDTARVKLAKVRDLKAAQ